MLPISDLVSHHLCLEDALCSTSPVSYVFGSNGVMTIHCTNFGRVGALAAGTDIPGLEQLPLYLIEWSIPQIPFDLFVSAVNTLKVAYASHKSESLIFICYDGDYFLHVPEQEVSSSFINYKLDIPPEHIVMHIHSHPGNLDRFSGIDDRDETNAGFYAVLSNMTAFWPSVTLSLCVGHNRVILSTPSDLSQVFLMSESMEPRLDMLSRIHAAAPLSPLSSKQVRVPSVSRGHKWSIYDDWDDLQGGNYNV